MFFCFLFWYLRHFDFVIAIPTGQCQQLSDRNCAFLRIFQSVLTRKFWHRHFQKGYLKIISKLLEKFVKFVKEKIEIIPPENIAKITQFSGSRTAIIGPQSNQGKKNGIWGFKTSISKHYCFCFRQKKIMCVSSDMS